MVHFTDKFNGEPREALQYHCSQMGPQVPMGTFFSLWVPIGSPSDTILGPRFLFLGFRTREKSVQPPSNVDYLITCKNTNYF